MCRTCRYIVSADLKKLGENKIPAKGFVCWFEFGSERVVVGFKFWDLKRMNMRILAGKFLKGELGFSQFD